MAELFLARSFGVAGFEKRLVIKRIRPEFVSDPRFVAMFINEAKIGVHLDHPNVVQVYDLGKVGTSWYIAMEHLHGRDLNRLVKALRAMDERLALSVAVAIVADAARGLAYAHSRVDADGQELGLVHRDVSPHNVLVTFAGDVKLVDFGIARLMNTAQGRADGVAPGRPGGGKYAYMSPEQAHGEEVDHRTDIFSAGIVLWELIVGHRLFQDPDPAEKLRRVQEAVIPHPADEGVNVHPALWEVLKRALARDRNDRYQNASLFEEDLRAWLYEYGEPSGRGQIAAAMARAFPGEAQRPALSFDVGRIVADVEQLDAPTLMTTGAGGTPTPNELPSNLRAADGERKPVVVLVIDVDGLTALSAEVEPEVLFKAHYQLLRWMTRIVDRFGGVLHRSIDDQILVLFGVPRTRADDAPRALECALELQRRAPELLQRGMSIELAIGAHSGEVTVSITRGRLRYEARGNTTRLARRLSSVADHGQVLVSERLLGLAGGEFRCRRGPDVANRGGRPAETSYLLEGRRRGLRVAGKGPWLRRGNELEVIRDALIELGGKNGRAILLLGGEGTGKSRLVREIRDRVQKRGLPTYVGRCAPWADAAADGLPDLLIEILGLDPEQSETEITDRFGRLSQLGLSRREIDHLALAWLPERSRALPSDPDEAWQALAKVMIGLCGDHSALFVIEDLHLLPDQLLPKLRRLIQTVIKRSALLLMTYRGALPPELQNLAEEVHLGAFDAAAQQRLLRGLLEVETIDPELAAFIERSCEGNPLYLEEMTKFLVSAGRIETHGGVATLVAGPDDSRLPESLAGLIGARIDRLDPAAKGALQLAAVIGPTFSTDLLANAAGLDDSTPIITELVAHGLIVRSSGADHWAFASELVREATLRGTLGIQRRDYHKLVAAAIERTDPDLKQNSPEMLALHCAEGGRYLDAARFAFRAGEVLERARALDRARDIYERGLTWIRADKERPETWDARVQGEALLCLRLGIVRLLMGENRKGEKSLQVALDIAGDAGLPWIEVRVHLELARSYLQRGKLDVAAAHLEQSRDLLVNEQDAELELDAAEMSAVLAYERGNNAEAERLWLEALRRASDDPAATARCLIGLANRHLRAGDLEIARPQLERALVAARRADDRILEGRVLNNIGLLNSSTGNLDEALASFRRALEVREGVGYVRGVVVNHHNIGDVHLSRGDASRAAVAFERSREVAADAGWDRGVVFNDIYLGYLDAQRGRESEGLARLHTACDKARQLGDVETAVTGEWLLGRWYIEVGRSDDARKQLAKASAEAKKYDLTALGRSIDVLATHIPAD